jgi:hypothetical protein
MVFLKQQLFSITDICFGGIRAAKKMNGPLMPDAFNEPPECD